ncbi:Erythromycin biosynthesis sensory transduction protein EryC1 [Dissostichus eleginoides]|uniref:Erythromycin biosynthesis sensory transduction protein EryC1 n=1 Tax=Dissostichus eleginoides TaxID=100907 RepID=A0AAD9F589_DISEL|nr:Erythromycin biosynthesis sensory transduction protein EryC1 [Dissostichus eleginoides]
MDKSISCCRKLYVVLLSQPCGKERTANDQCQTNLLQLTCAVNVEPSDPDLDGNHCKYFPASLSLKEEVISEPMKGHIHRKSAD